MRIKVGDEVEVIAGNYKGQRGAVQRVILSKDRIVVKGVNVVKSTKNHKIPAVGHKLRAVS